MLKASTWVGMDVHKKDIVVALIGARSSEVVSWKLLNEPRSVRRLARKLKRGLLRFAQPMKLVLVVTF